MRSGSPDSADTGMRERADSALAPEMYEAWYYRVRSPWCRMMKLPQARVRHNGDGNLPLVCRRLGFCVLAAVLCLARTYAQEDQLNKVHVEPPASTSAPGTEPKGAEAGPESGPAALRVHPGSFIRMNVDLVLVPITVTDPLNRLVTGLEKEDFQVYENNGEQNIASFAC